MASKVAIAIRMEEAINRLVENVEKLGQTVEIPSRMPTQTAEWAALVDSVSDALESIVPVEPAKTTKKKTAAK